MNEHDWRQKLIRMQAESTKWSMDIFAENKDLLSKIIKDLDISEISSSNNTKLLEHVLKLQEDAKTFEEYRDFYKLYVAISTIQIHDNLDIGNMDSKSIAAVYLLGCFHGSLEAVDDENMPTELYENYFHSARSRRAMEEGRWKKTREEYDEALAYAENSWEEGDELWHHQMANHLIEKYPELSRASLKKKLIPIAKKYDRFWNPGRI